MSILLENSIYEITETEFEYKKLFKKIIEPKFVCKFVGIDTTNSIETIDLAKIINMIGKEFVKSVVVKSEQ
jgi:hypothetical protein